MQNNFVSTPILSIEAMKYALASILRIGEYFPSAWLLIACFS